MTKHKKANTPHLEQVRQTFSVVCQRPYVTFLLGLGLGFLFFWSFFGLHIVNPFYIDWLLVPSDLQQHFLGWQFYRSEPWTLPLGSIEQLAYPFGISLTYTDSIPLVAIPLKLFESLLPEHFQYFGAWGLLCYMLQGGIAAMIIRRYTKNTWVVVLGAALFILSPILLSRIFSHTALASHWILLAGIWALLARESLDSTKKYLAVWSSLFSIAALVHPYLLPMVAVPFAISLILTHTHWRQSLVKAITPIVTSLTVFWIAGGLVVGSKEARGGGLGDYGLNLNSLYNSFDWSTFFPVIKNVNESGETMAYLGLGVLLLIPVVTFIALAQLRTLPSLKQLLQKFRWRYLLVVAVIVGICILAMSPRVQFGSHVLVELWVPGRVREYWSTFRASARLFWVVYYMLLFGMLIYVIKAWGKRSQAALVSLLILIVSIQFIDIRFSPEALAKAQHFRDITSGSYVTPVEVNQTAWQSHIGERKHLVYLEEMPAMQFFALGQVAEKHHLTMNTGYFARAPQFKIEAYQRQQIQLLKHHKADTKNNLYVTQNTTLARTLREHGYTIISLDGFFVIN